MAGTIERDDDSYKHFAKGVASGVPPLSDMDKKVIKFSTRNFGNLSSRDHAIRQNLGMNSVNYFQHLQSVKEHSSLSPRVKNRLDDVFTSQQRKRQGTL
jgi:hypothetical protein